MIGVVDQRAQAVTSTPLSGDSYAGVEIGNPRAATIVWPTKPGALSYRAKPGTHVILDAPEIGGFATISTRRDGDACSVKVTPGGSTLAQPLIATLDTTCVLTIDPATASAHSAIGTKPSRAPRGSAPEPRSSRAGCCGAQTTPGSPIAMAIVVLAIVLRRKDKR